MRGVDEDFDPTIYFSLWGSMKLVVRGVIKWKKMGFDPAITVLRITNELPQIG